MQQMMSDQTLVNTVAAALIREELYDKVRVQTSTSTFPIAKS